MTFSPLSASTLGNEPAVSQRLLELFHVIIVSVASLAPHSGGRLSLYMLDMNHASSLATCMVYHMRAGPCVHACVLRAHAYVHVCACARAASMHTCQTELSIPISAFKSPFPQLSRICCRFYSNRLGGAVLTNYVFRLSLHVQDNGCGWGLFADRLHAWVSAEELAALLAQTPSAAFSNPGQCRTPWSAHHPHKSHDDHHQCNPGVVNMLLFSLVLTKRAPPPLRYLLRIGSPLWRWYVVGGPLQCHMKNMNCQLLSWSSAADVLSPSTRLWANVASQAMPCAHLKVNSCHLFSVLPLLVFLACVCVCACTRMSGCLQHAPEELAMSLHNDTVGGLLNATFGNAIEMILTVQALRSVCWERSHAWTSILCNLHGILERYCKTYFNGERSSHVAKPCILWCPAPGRWIVSHCDPVQSLREGLFRELMRDQMVNYLLSCGIAFQELEQNWRHSETDLRLWRSLTYYSEALVDSKIVRGSCRVLSLSGSHANALLACLSTWE